MTKAELKAIQTLWLLKLAYGFVFIIAGFDKMPFMHKIAHWDQYLSPALTKILVVQPSFLIMLAGLAQIVIGGLIVIRTRLGAWIAIGCLLLVIINLLRMEKQVMAIGHDILLMVGLLALIWLTHAQADIQT